MLAKNVCTSTHGITYLPSRVSGPKGHITDGAQVSPERVEAMIRHDGKVLTKYRLATVGKKGGDRRSDQARADRESQPKIKHDNIMVDTPRQGTSRAYTLARLSSEAPALHAAVCDGRLSANAAAIQAGLRRKPTALERWRLFVR
jgi:hypothetical protein